MCRRRFYTIARSASVGEALAAVLMAVLLGGLAGGEAAFGAESSGLSWRSPAPLPAAAIQQTSMQGEAVPPPRHGQTRPSYDAGSPRMAMRGGEIVMDGDGMMFDEDSVSLGMSGGMLSEPCTTCRTPPWHGSVAPQVCYGPGQCGPVCDPCDPCQPCDPCDAPHRRSCFPRLQALFGKGYMPYPMPPCEPRCNHCGTPIPVGF